MWFYRKITAATEVLNFPVCAPRIAWDVLPSLRNFQTFVSSWFHLPGLAETGYYVAYLYMWSRSHACVINSLGKDLILVLMLHRLPLTLVCFLQLRYGAVKIICSILFQYPFVYCRTFACRLWFRYGRTQCTFVQGQPKRRLVVRQRSTEMKFPS